MKINLKSLSRIVRQNLFEADALKSKLEKIDTSQISRLEKMSKERHENGMCKYAFRMTGIEKLGINPGYEFDNPRGIYAYPLSSEMLKSLLYGSLPYMNNAKYVSVFEIKNPQKWLNTSKNEPSALTYDEIAAGLEYDSHEIINWESKCKEIFLTAYEKFDFFRKYNFTAFLDFSKKKGKHWNINNSCKIYDFSYCIANEICSIQLGQEKQGAVWQWLLMSAGYEGVYDDGKRVLHPNEPSQLVALSKSAIKEIEMFETKHIRRQNLFTKPEDEIEKIKNFKIIEKLVKQANSDETDPRVLEKLSRHENVKVRRHVSRNPKTPPSALDWLANDKVVDIAGNVAENPSTSHETLMKLTNHHDHSVRICLIKSPYSEEAIYLKLARDENIFVREEIANSLLSPKAALKAVAIYSDERSVLWNLAKNENSDAEILDIIAKKLDEKDKFLARSIASHKNTGSETLAFLSKSSDFVIRRNIAYNKNVSVETLVNLSDDDDYGVLCYIARNDKTPAHILEKLSNSYSDDVKLSVLNNKNTPIEAIRKMINDRNEHVKTKAIAIIVDQFNRVK